MIEVVKNANILQVKNSDNSLVLIDTENKKVSIGDFGIDFPGEYEKFGILAEVKQYQDKLFYSIVTESKNILIIFDDMFEMKEEIMSFFGDIDVLFISGTKNASKIAENIETRVIIPFGEGKDLFLHALGQHKEEMDVFKLKSEIGIENTEYVNLK